MWDRPLSIIVVCALVGGCGGSSAGEGVPPPRYVEGTAGGTTSGGATSGGTAGGTEAPPAPGPVACGATFSETRGRPCTEGGTCQMAEGSCACPANVLYASHCGGAAFLPVQLGRRDVWVCTPTDPTADRGDGCPFTQPAEGDACSRQGAPCQYGGPDGCGRFAGAVARCDAGHWNVAVSHPVPYQ